MFNGEIKFYIKNTTLLLVFVFLLSWSIFGASLYIAPSAGSFWSGCVQEFSVWAMIWNSEVAIWADLFIDSNMEFVRYVNWNLFKYSPPPKQIDGLVKIALFWDVNGAISAWWELGKIYFKVWSWENKKYINFIFNWVGETADTNLVINWEDILSFVTPWEYSIDDTKECMNIDNEILFWEEESLDDFMQKFNDDHRSEKRKKYLMGNNIYYFIWIILVLFLIWIIFFLRRKNK